MSPGRAAVAIDADPQIRRAHASPLDTMRRADRRQAASREDRGFAITFASISIDYGLTIFPKVARELAHWRARAEQIPDATLRQLALRALAKRGNMEGAALFAVLAPRARRAEAVRALVAFQAAYNHADLLAEQPRADPVLNGRELHDSLLVALGQSSPNRDQHISRQDSGDGYLAELVETSRTTLASLPSYHRVVGSALAAAQRIVEFQSLNLGEGQGVNDGLERWAREQNPPEDGLRWWEIAAAAGSSLEVHALIGLAARSRLCAEEVAAVGDAYHPWIGALHSMLDSLVDAEEDRRERQRNLLGYYTSTGEARDRLRRLAKRACSEASALADGDRHEAIVRAMASYYLSAAAAREAEALPLARAVVKGGGPRLASTLPLFRAARVGSRILRASR